MSRIYVKLDCGCFASCDSGGGLDPCHNENCRFETWSKYHPLCDWCACCLNCYKEEHTMCKEELEKYDKR